MSNHFHLLLELPPLAVGGFSDAELLGRLSALYSPAVVVRKDMKKAVATEERAQLERSRDVAHGKILRCRIRCSRDGAVIGSRNFVNEAFESSRVRFGPKRKDGARKIRGAGAPAAGFLWSMRDLQKGDA